MRFPYFYHRANDEWLLHFPCPWGFMNIKPTKAELFSEREGFCRVYRIWGLSFVFRRWRKIP